MLEGVQVIDREFRYLYVNGAVAKQAKSSRRELIGRSMMENFPGIEKSDMFGFLKLCMADGKPHQMINEFDFPDGSKGYFELRLQPVVDGVLILSFDVTGQKVAEKAVLDANLFLEEKVRRRTSELTAKNRELEQFVFVASHDLQEPMRTISNYISVLQEDYGQKLDPAALRHLQAMDGAAKRQQALIRALLEYSRLGRDQEPIAVDMAKMVGEVISDLRNLIESSGAVITVGGMPKVKGFETELRQVFQNLITNAIKFRKPGAVPKVAVESEQADGKWRFSVRDNGIGIDPRHFGRIFQMFQRLHSNAEYEGNGIGLANCKKVVELHGGEISVQSALGEGSSFAFTLEDL